MRFFCSILVHLGFLCISVHLSIATSPVAASITGENRAVEQGVLRPPHLFHGQSTKIYMYTRHDLYTMECKQVLLFSSLATTGRCSTHSADNVLPGTCGKSGTPAGRSTVETKNQYINQDIPKDLKELKKLKIDIVKKR